jgi:hypothetical protein
LRLDELADLNYFFCKKYADEAKTFPGFDAELNKARKKIIN